MSCMQNAGTDVNAILGFSRIPSKVSYFVHESCESIGFMAA